MTPAGDTSLQPQQLELFVWSFFGRKEVDSLSKNLMFLEPTPPTSPSLPPVYSSFELSAI